MLGGQIAAGLLASNACVERRGLGAGKGSGGRSHKDVVWERDTKKGGGFEFGIEVGCSVDSYRR